MNTQGGFCDLAILSLKQMANRKFTLSSATKQKLNWLKAQWVNETCRNLQAKVIKAATIEHFEIVTRIVTGCCSQQDLSLR